MPPKPTYLAQGAELKTEVAAFRGDLKADIAAGRTDITERFGHRFPRRAAGPGHRSKKRTSPRFAQSCAI